MDGIKCIKEYRDNPGKYLPMIDHERKVFEKRNEFGDLNIGWNCGFIGNRPYFYEVWATEGITVLTVFVSSVGIEDCEAGGLEKLLIEDAGIYKPKEGYLAPGMVNFVDENGNDFHSFNVTVGLDDEPAVIDGAKIYPFTLLNELNG